MGLRKDVKELISLMQEINKKVETIENELLPGTAKKAHEGEEIKRDVDNVRIKVSNNIDIIDNHGNNGIKISYEVDPIELCVDDEGKLPYNARFVAMNKLNLLDYEDMRRISKALERFIR
jgi:hypothetical protein